MRRNPSSGLEQTGCKTPSSPSILHIAAAIRALSAIARRATADAIRQFIAALPARSCTSFLTPPLPGVATWRSRVPSLRLSTAILLFLASCFCLLATNPARANCTVAGELQPNYPAGSKHYVYASHKFQYCDGTNWLDMPIAGTAGACTPETDFKYDAGLVDYKYCDATNWRKLACASTAQCAGNALPQWSTPAPQTKITASDAATSDSFGQSVAMSGTRAVIGAYAKTVGGFSTAGAAYVFDLTNPASPVQKAEITDPVTVATNDSFGQSVAVSGNIALIGAYGKSGYAGAVYVYDISNPSSPVQKAVITASDGAASDYFGQGVAVYGTIAVIGAMGKTVGANSGAGAAYVFDLTNPASPVLKAEITDPVGAIGDHFGHGVAVYGTIAVIGAYGYNGWQGAAYVFDLSSMLSSIGNGENATDLLGEYDRASSAANVVYTKLNINNAPGDLGLNSHEGMALDAVNHRLFVADNGNSRVLVFNLNTDNSLASRVAAHVLGQPNFYTRASNTTQSVMYSPSDVAYDAANNRLFVVDTNRVLVYNVATITDGMNAAYELGQPSGTAFTTSTAATTQSGMNTPLGVAYDATNNRLFVSDAGNNRVLVFNTATITNGMNAAYELGQPSGTAFTTNTMATTQSGMNSPNDVAYDATNNRLFVADLGNSRVLVYNTATITNGMNAANELGQTGFTTRTNVATQAGMNIPYGVTYDAANNRLFVADTNNNRVLVYDLTPAVGPCGASPTVGQVCTDGSVYAGLSTDGSVQMYTQRCDIGMSWSGSACTGTRTGTCWDNCNTVGYTTTGMTNADTGKSNTATLVTLDSDSGVAGTQPHRAAQTCVNLNEDGHIDWYLPAKNELNVLYSGATAIGNFDLLAGSYWTSTENNNSTVWYQGFNYGAQGNGYKESAFDVRCVRKIDTITNGMNAAYELGQPSGTAFTTNTSATTQSGMNSPRSFAFDAANNRLFVADHQNNRVLVFNTSTITNGMNAADLLGHYDSILTLNPVYTTTNNDDSPGELGFRSPAGIAFDTTNHRLFVADASNYRVLVFNLNTDNTLPDKIADNVLGQPDFHTYANALTQAGMGYPNGIAFDAANNRLFVVDNNNNRVLVYNTSTITNGMNAAYELGQPSGTAFTTNTAATSQSGMSGPQGLAFDAANNRLFVADASNYRVLVYNTATITNGMNAAYELGQPSGTAFTTATQATTQGGMKSPDGIAYDGANHRLFVADYANARVLVFDVTPGTIANGELASYELGQPSGAGAFTTLTTATTQGGMNWPQGVAYDATNNRLFVMDSLNHRVLAFNTATITNGMNAANVLGAGNFTTNTSGVTTQGGLYNPQSAAFDATNNRLFVADYQNNRLMIFAAAPHVPPVQEATLTASDGAGADYFGASAGVYGNTALIGAYGKTVSANSGAGAAYVFDLTNPASPVQKAEITDPVTVATNDFFGGSAAVYGNAAVIGAYGKTAAPPAPCGASPTVGQVCTDGSVYAGLSTDAGTPPMYTQRCDIGMSWSGSACTGTRTTMVWSAGITIATGYTNADTGKANTLGLYPLSNADSPYTAAITCHNLNEDGHTDWYLPAKNELNVLYTNHAAIGNFDTANPFWTSTEYTYNVAWFQYFSNGLQSSSYTKFSTFDVRCVRKNDASAGAGAAYVFDLTNPASPVQLVQLTASDNTASANFGYSAAVYGNTALIGANKGGASSTGEAYVFYPFCTSYACTTNGACTSTYPQAVAGSFKYVPGSYWEYCDGTNWIPVGPCGAPGISFTDKTGVAFSTLTTSNIASGVTCDSTAVSIAGASGSPQYRICADGACSTVVQTWGSAAGTVNAGQYIQLELTSSASSVTTNSATLTVGAGSTTWNVTTYLGYQRVFVDDTSSFSGAIGSVAAANALCASAATGANLGGTWKAWIAVTTGVDAPATTFTHPTLPYKLLDGTTTIANNWTGLISGTLLAGISKNASGGAVTANVHVWTNVAAASGAATVSGSSSTGNCTAWTSYGGSPNKGGYGLTGSTAAAWTASSTQTCSTASWLYCFEQ
jgi:DNA-binding beta-propeller fold protein YncE